METQPLEESHQEGEIGIDFRKYIDWAFRWAWLIGLCVVVVGGVSLLGSLLLSRGQPYEATATIVLLKSRTEVTMGSAAIKTLSDETLTMKAGSSIDTLQAVGSALTNIEASRTYRRLNSLVGMVKNGAVAEQVSEDLKGVLDDKERKPSVLAASIKAQAYTPEGSAAVKGSIASDSLLIIASQRDPEKAALIANTWAKRYEAYVNSLFGGSAVAPYGEIDAQVIEARARYDTAQTALVKYLSEENLADELQRQIAEEEAIIAKLRTGRQTAAVAIVDKQVAVKQQLVNAYLESDTNNRLLAFNKGQEAKRQILGAWADAEAANRLAAIERDRDIRMNVFTNTVASEIATRQQVLTEQRDDILNRLSKAYARKQSLEGLLVEAGLMRDQLISGGAASARSNALSLLAFKNRVFATLSGLPAFDKLALQVTSFDALAEPRDAADQLADLKGLITAMQAEIASLNKSIQEQSQAVLQGLAYQGLDQISSQYLSAAPVTRTLGITGTLALAPAAPVVSAPGITGTVAITSTASITGTPRITGTVANTMDLNTFIAQRYADLFEVGTLAQGAKNIATDTPLFAEIKALYPQLFAKDAMVDLTTSVGDITELSNLASQAVEDLLQMKGLEGISASAIASKPLSQQILQREERVRQMLADVARLNQVKADLQRTRDLEWQAYSTLSSKQQEVRISAATEGTEVKIAAPAVTPTKRVTGASLALSPILGLLAGVIAAFVLEYQGIVFGPQDLWKQVSRLWRRKKLPDGSRA